MRIRPVPVLGGHKLPFINLVVGVAEDPGADVLKPFGGQFEQKADMAPPLDVRLPRPASSSEEGEPVSVGSLQVLKLPWMRRDEFPKANRLSRYRTKRGFSSRTCREKGPCCSRLRASQSPSPC